jgi:hypothetical protein
MVGGNHYLAPDTFGDLISLRFSGRPNLGVRFSISASTSQQSV